MISSESSGYYSISFGYLHPEITSLNKERNVLWSTSDIFPCDMGGLATYAFLIHNRTGEISNTSGMQKNRTSKLKENPNSKK